MADVVRLRANSVLLLFIAVQEFLAEFANLQIEKCLIVPKQVPMFSLWKITSCQMVNFE